MDILNGHRKRTRSMGANAYRSASSHFSVEGSRTYSERERTKTIHTKNARKLKQHETEKEAEREGNPYLYMHGKREKGSERKRQTVCLRETEAQ